MKWHKREVLHGKRESEKMGNTVGNTRCDKISMYRWCSLVKLKRMKVAEREGDYKVMKRAKRWETLLVILSVIIFQFPDLQCKLQWSSISKSQFSVLRSTASEHETIKLSDVE